MAKKTENITLKIFEFDKNFGKTVGGCDEAGRGPLAGPVVCAVVVMPLDEMIEGINDSKQVSEAKREELYSVIIQKAVCYSIETADRAVIDEINILNATKLCMTRAINALTIPPQTVLVDAVSVNADFETFSIVKGDEKSYNIAAASILAKVTRDRIMRRLDQELPGYGFYKNKGYGTAEHIAALKKLGASPQHRVSFLKNFFDSLPAACVTETNEKIAEKTAD